MSSSAAAAAVLRYALRRPPSPRVFLTGRQPAATAAAQNFRAHRFYSADCTAVGKPAGTKTLDSQKLDEVVRVFGETNALLVKVVVEKIERDRRRRKMFVSGTIFAGVLAAVYVKQRFFGGTEEDKQEMTSTGNNN